MASPDDPAALFRTMLGEWEKMANSFGNEAMKREEFARGMQGASAAGMTMQAGMRDMMERALAASNLPTKSDVEAIGARLAAIEASLARIEAQVAPPPPSPRAKPTRGRKPPKPD